MVRTASFLSRTEVRLRLDRLSIMTKSLGRSSGPALCEIGLEPVAVVRPVELHRRGHAHRALSATSVVLLWWPCGKPILSRAPFRQRPWLRVMLVTVRVSSMKTGRSGST